MDANTLGLMAAGFLHVFSPMNLGMMILGVTIGIVIGCMPGLSAAMGVALLLPLTFGMKPETGLIMLGAIYCGAIFGGSISAILIHTPGTPASAATAIDGYQLTLKGKAGKALGTACTASFFGGLLSCISLYFFAPALAQLAMKFGSPEYFWLALFGLTIIAGVTSGSMVKGLMSGAFGLILSTIGMDPMEGVERYMFGIDALYNGINVTCAMIGLFSMSQVFMLIEKAIKERGNVIDFEDSVILKAKELAQIFPHVIRSWIIGNPTLTLGIPGESVTAVLMGGLIIQGLQPGPELFTKYAEMTYTFFAGFVVTQFFMLMIGLGGCRLFAHISRLSDAILIPCVFVLCVVGSFAINNSFVEVGIMFLFGFFGYLMRKLDLNTAAVVLALILGPIGERGLRRSLTLSGNDISILFSTPICWILIAMCILSSFSPLLMKVLKKREKAGEAK